MEMPWPVFDTLEARKKQGFFIDAGLRAAGGIGVENVVQLLLPRRDFFIDCWLTSWMDVWSP
jgi:hypothetical protein